MLFRSLLPFSALRKRERFEFPREVGERLLDAHAFEAAGADIAAQLDVINGKITENQAAAERAKGRIDAMAKSNLDAAQAEGGMLAHQLGTQNGPGWLDATAGVLNLPAAMDAVAHTVVHVRQVPLAVFQAALPAADCAPGSILRDVAQSHRQQTELAVSRLAKDAEARCAEWLLSQAQDGAQGSSAVQLQQRKRLIAAQLGIAPETLSRVLRHLRERQLISGSGRTVQLVDPAGLRSLAEL